MQEDPGIKATVKAAFPVTIPVMLGYIFVGIAFGLLIDHSGLNFLWAGLISLTVYAGSMQFVLINFLAGAFSLAEIAIITLLVNMRHMVYGLTFIEKFQNMGRLKPYAIFALTDETYALLCASKVPSGIPAHSFYFAVAMLNQSYWIIGSVIGALFGALIPFNTTGIEFTMTALFAVICTEQWLTFPLKGPALIGAACAFASLLIFGAANMLLPAMIAIILISTVARPVFEKALIGKAAERCK